MAKKIVSFITDKDGFTKEDYEKLTTGVLFTLAVMVVLYVYLTKLEVNRDMVYLCTALGGLFVVRQAFSFNRDVKIAEIESENEPIIREGK